MSPLKIVPRTRGPMTSSPRTAGYHRQFLGGGASCPATAVCAYRDIIIIDTSGLATHNYSNCAYGPCILHYQTFLLRKFVALKIRRFDEFIAQKSWNVIKLVLTQTARHSIVVYMRITPGVCTSVLSLASARKRNYLQSLVVD